MKPAKREPMMDNDARQKTTTLSNSEWIVVATKH